MNSENILHHPSVPRNHHLMELLDRLHLVNRTNMGVPRIYRSLLIEGKEPPSYREVGNSIELNLIASSLFPDFKKFVAELQRRGISLDVDHLLILQYLLRHEQIDTHTAMRVAQRGQDQARELLSNLTNDLRLLGAIGRGKGRYYTLSKATSDALKEKMSYERQVNLDDEAVKMRILTLLREEDLTNKDIRDMTGWDRKKVYNIVKQLESEGVTMTGQGRGARYTLVPKTN
ncbi:helix-turn-helix domain-containing protein [Filibacter tadaridae]|uniref:helix-turn-helix domain-containing protein n=1 Tax=Filibacter tadaridae TaxID=2483811 RepID=UPI0039E7A5B4